MKPDDDMKADAIAELAWDPSIDEMALDVAGKDGARSVMLRSFDHDWLEREATVGAAWAAPRACRVVDEVEFKPARPS